MELSKAKANLLVATSAILWGTSFVVIRFGLQYIDPLLFVFLRFASATLLFFPLMLLKKRKIKKILLRRDLLAIGFFNAMAFLFQYLGQALTTAAKAALFVNFYVIIVPVFAPYFLKENRSWKAIISGILGFIGVFFVSTNLRFKELTQGSILGDSLTFVASIAWTGYILFSKKYLGNDEGKDEETISEMDVFFSSIFFSTIFLTPGLLYNLSSSSFNTIIGQFTWESIVSLVYLVLFCTIGAFLIYLHALKSANASESSVFLLLEIIVAFILEIILFFFFPSIFPDAIPEVWTVVGTILIISAVLIVSIEFKKKNKELKELIE